MTQLDPAKALIDWFSSQPREIQGDVAGLLTYFCPGLNSDGTLSNTDDVIQKFTIAVGDAGKNSISGTGLLVSLRACFDFLFAKRGTEDGWELPEAVNRQILEDDLPEDLANMKETAREFLADLPRRKAIWKATCDSWKMLCDGPLSDAALRAAQNHLLTKNRD